MAVASEPLKLQFAAEVLNPGQQLADTCSETRSLVPPISEDVHSLSRSGSEIDAEGLFDGRLGWLFEDGPFNIE